MKTFWNVKTLLSLSSLFFCLGASAAEEGKPLPWSPRPQFDCGTYILHGVLKTNDQGYYTLVMRDKSPSVFDVILLGGELEKKIDLNGTFVAAEVYFPTPNKSNLAPMAYLQNFLKGDPKKVNPIFVRKQACGMKDKLKPVVKPKKGS